MEIYKHIFPVDLVKMPNCKTANAVKLTTNVFRDINIAFVNELALLYEKLGIDIITVLEAADKKYNFQLHFPGAGVGGPCLPVNSYQMINSAQKINSELLKIVKIGREVNEKMPKHVVSLLENCFNESKTTGKNILLLGISYKPDVKDIQLSPAKNILDELQNKKFNVRIYDPYFKSEDIFNIKIENDLNNILPEIDGIILVTAHKEFFGIDPGFLASKMRTPILVDTRAVFNIHEVKKAGLVFRGLGRGT